MIDLLVATRSSHKLREIRQILPDLHDLRFRDLEEARIPWRPEEDAVEAFTTFEENALAKARHFVSLTPLPVLADDSGLVVDALDGAPGVRSKRFSGRTDLDGNALDQANNQRLLEALGDLPLHRRTARYVCALALLEPGGDEHLFQGACEGLILSRPRGSHGFGYDPLFFVPGEDATFGELPPQRKNELSHRAHALRQARSTLLALASPPRS